MSIQSETCELLSISHDQIKAAFNDRYKAVFGSPLRDIPIRVLNLKVSVVGRRPNFDLHLLAPGDGEAKSSSVLSSRPVWVNGDWVEATIYERLELPIDMEIEGPAILEQPDATIFIDPDLYARVDEFGNLVISRKEI